MFRHFLTLLLLSLSAQVLGQVGFDGYVVFAVPEKATKSLDDYLTWEGLDQKVLGFAFQEDHFECYRSTSYDAATIHSLSIPGNRDKFLEKYAPKVRDDWYTKGFVMVDSNRTSLLSEPMISMRLKNSQTGKLQVETGLIVYGGNLYTFVYHSKHFNERIKDAFFESIELSDIQSNNNSIQTNASQPFSAMEEETKEGNKSLNYTLPIAFVLFIGGIVAILALKSRRNRKRDF